MRKQYRRIKGCGITDGGKARCDIRKKECTHGNTGASFFFLFGMKEAGSKKKRRGSFLFDRQQR
jgi:hypothetical protein